LLKESICLILTETITPGVRSGCCFYVAGRSGYRFFTKNSNTTVGMVALLLCQ